MIRSTPEPAELHTTSERPWWDMRAYDYDLPADLIAQQPAPERDASRLLVYDRAEHRSAHQVFRDLPQFVGTGDVMVINDCRVFPARLYARRAGTEAPVELLLCEQLGATRWSACVKPGRKCRAGVALCVDEVGILIRAVREDGLRELEFECEPHRMHALLETHGIVPLPPYITRPQAPSRAEDRARYQTVYAAQGAAVAAPTAGLHFTAALLEQLHARGCCTLPVTLNVGLGTFQPVKGDDARQHRMHAEHAVVPAATAEALNVARTQGRRIIAVGTTVVRALESCLDARGMFRPFNAPTSIFIHPPQRICAVDALITNFHLPHSTLLMLVAAFIGPAWRSIYAEAICKRYRFYSYGDAMLLM